MISWSIRVQNSRLLRFCVYTAISVLGGMFLLAVCGSIFFIIVEIRHGDFSIVVLALLLALIGGPFSLLYLLPVLRDADQRPSPTQFIPFGLSLRMLPVLALCGALLLFASTQVAPIGPLIVFGIGIFVLLPIASAVQSDGKIDTEENTLTYYNRTVDLVTLSRVRRLRVGDLSFLWLSYVSGTATTLTPRLVVLPTDIERRTRETFEAGVSQPVEDEHHGSPRAVSIALGLFGFLFLSFGGIVFLIDQIPYGVSVYFGVFLGLFGVIFLWAALTT
jgi:hypothetical protein